MDSHHATNKDIYSLSSHQIQRLQSIDPVLDESWKPQLKDIMDKLDDDTQTSIHKRILKPRGIFYNTATFEYDFHPPKPLKDVIHTTINNSENKRLIILAKSIQDLLQLDSITTNPPTHDAIELAETLEILIGQFSNVEIDEETGEHLILQSLKQSFLYELANWITYIKLTTHIGMRKLDAKMIKSYFKEVFLKQQIQGWDFRSWDASDIDTLDMPDFPPQLKEEIKQRRCSIVETSRYWFVVGQASTTKQNAFSFRRFLYEDHDSGFVYLTHVGIDKNALYSPESIEQISYSISRIYTLERTTNDKLKKFIQSIKKAHSQNLEPLLKKRFLNYDLDFETMVGERMLEYEKSLIVLILNKLPKMVDIASKNENDQDFLFYHLDVFIKQLIDNVEDFRLQPFASFTLAAQQMMLRLLSFRVLLRKIDTQLAEIQTAQNEQNQDLMQEPLNQIKKFIQESENILKEIQNQRDIIAYHQDIQSNGKFWQKLLHKPPLYSLEELEREERRVNEVFFINIVRLAKEKKECVIYPEFECHQTFDDDFRHYALPDGEKGLSRLPFLIRLPEDRRKFYFEPIIDQLNNRI